jgi:hypothetical protein
MSGQMRGPFQTGRSALAVALYFAAAALIIAAGVATADGSPPQTVFNRAVLGLVSYLVAQDLAWHPWGKG